MLKFNKKQNNGVSALDTAPITTVLGSEMIFTGDIQGGSTIKIDGKITGNINVDNGIILGEKAVVEGNLKSDNIIIFGTLHGDIQCNELILKNSGSIHGDITTNTIEIEMGGKYNGKLKMNQMLNSTEEK